MKNRLNLAERYQRQIADQLSERKDPTGKCIISQMVAKRSSEKTLIRQDHTKTNKWEQEWEDLLRKKYDYHKGGVSILPQSIRLKLANGAWYKPDIVVVGWGESGSTHFLHAYEVKGFRRQAGILTVKVAASKYPWINFKLCTKRGGEWIVEAVNP